MAGLVGEPRRAGQIANRVKAFNVGAAHGICHHMCAVDGDAELFQT